MRFNKEFNLSIYSIYKHSMSARIYSLTCNITGLMYIGSTRKTLQERLVSHKANYNSWTKGKTGKITAFDEIIPLNDYRIELIEEIPECTGEILAVILFRLLCQ